jgi:hypothetical protein
MKNPMHLDSNKSPFSTPPKKASMMPMGSSAACAPTARGKAPTMTSANATMKRGGGK